MEEKVNSADTNGLTARQQRLLLRAVVGSLVLSAAFAHPAAAQEAHPRENTGLISVRVHAQPFRELLAHVRHLAESGDLGAGDSFAFTVEAQRNADGTLRAVKFTKSEATNAYWRPLTERFVSVLGDSRALAYLEGVERVTFTVSLGERFAAELAAVAADDSRATRHANTFGLLFTLARDSQQGRPGIEILNNMRVSASGKRLLMKLDMTRAEVGNLLSTTRAIP